MNLTTVVQKLAKGEISYALGRFGAVRWVYSAIMWTRETMFGRDGFSSRGATAFPRISVERALSDLSRDAVALGFDLPPDLTASLVQYARDKPCRCSGDSSVIFRWSDVRKGMVATGHSIVIGFVQDPGSCPAVALISQDPVLLEVVTR